VLQRSVQVGASLAPSLCRHIVDILVIHHSSRASVFIQRRRLTVTADIARLGGTVLSGERGDQVGEEVGRRRGELVRVLISGVGLGCVGARGQFDWARVHIAVLHPSYRGPGLLAWGGGHSPPRLLLQLGRVGLELAV
jgi:hypothetical protein